MIVSAGIVNNQVDLLALKILGSLKDVETRGFIIFGEDLLLVVNDQTRFTNGCVTNKDQLQLFRRIWVATNSRRLLWFGP